MIRLLAVAVVALAAAVVVPLSTASAPIRAVFDLDAVTFPDAYLTDACGVGVDVTITGTIHVTLFVDYEGHATHEVDTFNGTITYSAGTNSVTVHGSSVSRATYPEGAVVGAPASVVVTGVGGGTFVGGPPGSGQVSFDAEIVFVDPDGLPITAAVGDLDLKGTFAATTASVCDALT
jgi:hypothetical protein